MLKKEGNSYPNVKLGELSEPCYLPAVGAGALLIHRSVLEEMKPPYFEINPSKIGGREMPEDYYFCMKVGDLGYKIALDTRVDTYHYGPAAWVHKYNDNKPNGKKESKEKKEKVRRFTKAR
jgi:hypothetical protein